MISLMEAIRSINPNAECTVPENVDNIIWLNNTTPIAKADILAKQKELQTEYDNNKYQRDRAVAYPSIQDVVVALAEKEEGNDAMWQEITAQRAKVKADNPKPE